MALHSSALNVIFSQFFLLAVISGTSIIESSPSTMATECCHFQGSGEEGSADGCLEDDEDSITDLKTKIRQTMETCFDFGERCETVAESGDREIHSIASTDEPLTSCVRDNSSGCVYPASVAIVPVLMKRSDASEFFSDDKRLFLRRSFVESLEDIFADFNERASSFHRDVKKATRSIFHKTENRTSRNSLVPFIKKNCWPSEADGPTDELTSEEAKRNNSRQLIYAIMEQSVLSKIICSLDQMSVISCSLVKTLKSAGTLALTNLLETANSLRFDRHIGIELLRPWLNLAFDNEEIPRYIMSLTRRGCQHGDDVGNLLRETLHLNSDERCNILAWWLESTSEDVIYDIRAILKAFMNYSASTF